MASVYRRRVILVTGSSSGIGRATADRLTRDGTSVYGGSRRTPDTQPASGWIPLPLDVTSDSSVEAAFGSIVEQQGHIDAVVHCAGISVAGAIEDVTVAEVERQLQTNYLGTIRVLRAALPLMRERRQGRLIVVGSIGGLIGLPFLGHYSASKFALDGMMQALRIEVAPFGIQATILHPGDIQTDISSNQLEGSRTGAASAYHGRFKATVETYDTAVTRARPPGVIADAVARLLDSQRMPPRVIAGTANERTGVVLKSLLPARVFELIIRKTYGL